VNSLRKSLLVVISILIVMAPVTVPTSVNLNAKAAVKSVFQGRYTPNEETVYVTKTGNKYHRGSCRYIKKSKIAMTKTEAQKKGYKACTACKP
jgi:hypothetical protein